MRPFVSVLAFIPLVACRPGEGHNAFGGPTETGSADETMGDDEETGSESGGSSDDGEDTDGYKFDLDAPDLPPVCDESGLFPHAPCEDATSIDRALGLGCEGEPEFELTLDVDPSAIGLRSKFGDSGVWEPREGDSFVVLGTAGVETLFGNECPVSEDIDGADHACGQPHDKGLTLPAPIIPTDVGDVTCSEDPNLVGTGDCSNTISAEWASVTMGGSCPGANDWAEIRLTAQVPPNATSISFDVAFFTKEYPFWKDSAYNDMFVAWLESDAWTGNISFDDLGNPLTLNASFFDYTEAPELVGTCMEAHGGTRWLTTTAPVTPGEEIELVFAVFDLGDSAYDTHVFLDNVRFGCQDAPPNTEPAG